MTESHLQIRAFQVPDLDELQKIREAAFAPVFQSFREIVGPAISEVALASEETEQAALLTKLCSEEAPDQVFVGVVDGRIVGFVAVSLDAEKKLGELGLNAVAPEHTGKGYGTALYRHALDVMKAAGMKAATVGTGGDPSHLPARRAYKKAGFGPTIPSQWMYRLL